MIRSAPLLAAFLVAGCGVQDNDPGPGGVTVGEASALDQAAEMLEQQRLPDDALDAGEAPTGGVTPSTLPTATPSPDG